MAKLRFIPLLLLASAAPAAAQYDQDISVEGKYVPEIINHDRIGVFPKPLKFPLEKSTLRYSLTGVNADFIPQAIPIQATGWKSTRDFSSHRGYLELGLGSWLESTLSAGYRFVDTSESAFGIRLQHNSTSLWKPKVCDYADTRMNRYDESVGLYGHHTFGDKGRLDAAVDYHIGNFNYYGFNPEIAYISQSDNTGVTDAYKAPTQTLNDVAARVAWHSPSGLDNISWNVGAGVRYFGYRRFYALASGISRASLTGGRETDVNINGGIVFPTSTKSALGIDLNADILSYGKTESKDGTAIGVIPPELDSYGMVSLTPFYRFTRSRLNIRIGARIDLAFNAGPEDNRYSVFHIAPSVRLDYNAGPATIFLHALGGNSLNTLAAGYDLNYYQAPALFSTAPVYTPLDAKLGASFGPFSGFHAGFDVAFRMSRGQYFGGFYQYWLNSADDLKLGLPAEIDARPVVYDLAPGGKSNLSGFSVGVELGYDAGRYFKINADGRWQRQDGKTGYFNGYDRPEWTASVTAETNPWSTLKFRIGYELRALRMMPVEAHYADTTPLNSDLIVMYRLPNMSMLNFGASYGITDNINVWLQADNLLNRKWQYMPQLPEPGIRIAAGVGIYF